MQGKNRTPKTDDLSLIFWHIRAARDAKTRRSWQRRARLALEKNTTLTPEERHEIAVTWSRADVSEIDSPALRKLSGKQKAAHEWQKTPARQHMRIAFDDSGRRRSKQPSRATELTRLSFGDAANERWPHPVQMVIF